MGKSLLIFITVTMVIFLSIAANNANEVDSPGIKGDDIQPDENKRIREEENRKLMEYIKSGKEIEWQRLYRAPEDVYFSHRRHVVFGNIECKTCHGDIGESSKPPSKALKITMKNCMDCHEEKEANNDCIACHR